MLSTLDILRLFFLFLSRSFTAFLGNEPFPSRSFDTHVRGKLRQHARNIVARYFAVNLTQGGLGVTRRRRCNVLQPASNAALTGRLIGIYFAENDLGI